MAFSLKQVVPWGRSFDEYVRMFALSAEDLEKRILGCGDGPAAFNAELTRRGGEVVSIDPLYRFSPQEIQKRIDETYTEVMAQVEANRGQFVWEKIGSPAELGRLRLQAMGEFLADFEPHSGRYQVGELPSLPFETGEFDLALCSHFLFLYSDQFSFDFHLASLKELVRVATEVRVFPLLALGSPPSPHLEPAIDHLQSVGIICSIEAVEYEFQRGGNQMLRLHAA